MNRKLILACLFMSILGSLSAQVLRQHTWRDRVLLVFTPDLQDNRFEAQSLILQTNYAEALQERRVVIYRVSPGQTIQPSGAFMREAQSQQLYLHYDVRPEDFTVILLGLDGHEKLRSRTPITATTLFETIDRMPMRRSEIGDGY